MTDKPKSILIKARNITKSYAQGVGMLSILKGVDIDIYQNESLAIVGASGAGKSTLLHILGTLDRPDTGEIHFHMEDLMKKSDDELAEFRNIKMGFVFQFHHLLSEFTALENVMLPSRIGNEDIVSAKKSGEELLELVGLAERMHHYPNQLSGGELQRVAIARALIRNPEILFADEPTGNLDSHNSQNIQKLFFDLKNKRGLTLVTVTHDAQFASMFDRRLRMRDGDWDKEI